MTTLYNDCDCGRRKEWRSARCFKCDAKHRAANRVPPALADYARQRFSEGYGPRVIAFEALRDGLIGGVSLEGLVQRLVHWRHRAGIPLLRVRRAVRGQPVIDVTQLKDADRRREESAEREAAKARMLEETMRLRRADTPCGWCDCTAPGRPCVECGRVAPRHHHTNRSA